MSDVESKGIEALRRLSTNLTWPPAKRRKVEVASWIAVHALRSPDMRRRATHAYTDSLASLQLDVSTLAAVETNYSGRTVSLEYAAIMQTLIASGIGLVPFTANHHAAMYNAHVQNLSVLIASRTPWLRVKFKDPCLLIGDSPVLPFSLTQEDGSDGPGGSQFLALPLNRTDLLLLGSTPTSDWPPLKFLPGATTPVWMEGTEGLADLINDLTPCAASDEIFSHPNDSAVADRAFAISNAKNGRWRDLHDCQHAQHKSNVNVL